MNQAASPAPRRADVSGRMRPRSAARACIAVALAVVASASIGCSTWEGMSRADKGTVIGAGVGGVAGNAVGDGSVLGTVGGAAIGGVIGREVSKERR